MQLIFFTKRKYPVTGVFLLFFVCAFSQSLQVKDNFRPVPEYIFTTPDSYDTNKKIGDNLYLVTGKQHSIGYGNHYDRYGLTDSVGRVILPCTFLDLIYISPDLIFVQENGLYFSAYDADGRPKFKTEYTIRRHKQGINTVGYIVYDIFSKEVCANGFRRKNHQKV